MKRVLLIIFSLLFFAEWVNAQVKYDFESDTQGFYDYGWGSAFDGVSRVADPTGQSGSTGVLQIAFNGSKGTGDAVGAASGQPDKTTAQFLTYYVWLPANTPDSLHLNLFCQDNKNWSHKTQNYWAVDIPKEVWFPLSFPLTQTELKGTDFDVVNNKFGWMGIDIGTWNSDPAVLAWTGNILIDNVSYLGVQPVYYANFEADAQGFYNYGWGAGVKSVEKIADPTGKSTGVIQVSYDGTLGNGGAFGAASGDPGPTAAPILSYDMWLPSNTPDSITFTLFCQDNSHWSHKTQVFYAKDIPKEVWYPLYFPLQETELKNTDFDVVAHKFGWMGIAVSATGSDATTLAWAGDILVDNVEFLSDQVGVKWVLNDFESTSLDKWSTPNYGPAATGLSIAANPDGSGGVLQAAIDFSKGINAAILRSNVKLVNSTVIDGQDVIDTVKEIDLDVYLPADFPSSSITIAYQIHADPWPWVQRNLSVSDSGGITRGKWNTLRWILADIADYDNGTSLPGLDWTTDGDVVVQLNISGSTYAGNIYFDNLTLAGVHSPVGEVLPVNLSSVIADTTNLPTGKVVNYAHLEWVDNTLASASYNLYYSEKAISGSNPSTASGVTKFAPGIPGGLHRYAFRPYSIDGSKKSYYFAVTSVDPRNGTETVLQTKSKKGPVEIETTPTFKIQYVKDFASKFVLDGLDDEFTDYKVNQIIPETGTLRAGSTWTPDSPDLSFKTTLVIDDKYLYISSDINDDDVNTDATMQAWQGDAIEYFIGFYDESKLSAWHGKNFSHTNGDWRFAFTSLGQEALDGGAGSTSAIPGCEATAYVKFTGDGYICEARIALDSLAAGNNFGPVYNGMKLPFRVDCNDHDATKGDAGRGGQCGVGGCPTGTAAIDLEQDWLRPHGWGWAEVIGAPTAVENTSLLPKEFKLYNNYPNPFNPTTTLKYDLPKETQVSLKVYDITGREVATLINTKQKAGYYELQFNASNLASGIYLYRIITNDFVKTNKMILLK